MTLKKATEIINQVKELLDPLLEEFYSISFCDRGLYAQGKKSEISFVDELKNHKHTYGHNLLTYIDNGILWTVDIEK